MSEKSDLPIILGANLRKGIMCMRVRNGYEMWIVWLNRDFRTGEHFELSDVDKIQSVIHFTDREAVQNTVDALAIMIKRRNPRKKKSVKNCGADMRDDKEDSDA